MHCFLCWQGCAGRGAQSRRTPPSAHTQKRYKRRSPAQPRSHREGAARPAPLAAPQRPLAARRGAPSAGRGARSHRPLCAREEPPPSLPAPLPRAAVATGNRMAAARLQQSGARAHTCAAPRRAGEERARRAGKALRGAAGRAGSGAPAASGQRGRGRRLPGERASPLFLFSFPFLFLNPFFLGFFFPLCLVPFVSFFIPSFFPLFFFLFFLISFSSALPYSPFPFTCLFFPLLFHPPRPPQGASADATHTPLPICTHINTHTVHRGASQINKEPKQRCPSSQLRPIRAVGSRCSAFQGVIAEGGAAVQLNASAP